MAAGEYSGPTVEGDRIMFRSFPRTERALSLRGRQIRSLSAVVSGTPLPALGLACHVAAAAALACNWLKLAAVKKWSLSLI